ncbi:hypothetical protein [Nonlabens dokdonensis]|uniref:hypothetical protein n=1 Tax=Nonlabens dokdonensis TaxID=328515 RepID=UPI0026EDED20|nr:hypothetical protein [Nonlabens dokdonensis]
MTVQEHASYLLGKFSPEKALEIVNETIDVWTIKKKHATRKREPNSLIICNRTLTYYDKLKNILQDPQSDNNQKASS